VTTSFAVEHILPPRLPVFHFFSTFDFSLTNLLVTYCQLSSWYCEPNYKIKFTRSTLLATAAYASGAHAAPKGFNLYFGFGRQTTSTAAAQATGESPVNSLPSANALTTLTVFVIEVTTVTGCPPGSGAQCPAEDSTKDVVTKTISVTTVSSRT